MEPNPDEVENNFSRRFLWWPLEIKILTNSRAHSILTTQFPEMPKNCLEQS